MPCKQHTLNPGRPNICTRKLAAGLPNRVTTVHKTPQQQATVTQIYLAKEIHQPLRPAHGPLASAARILPRAAEGPVGKPKQSHATSLSATTTTNHMCCGVTCRPIHHKTKHHGPMATVSLHCQQEQIRQFIILSSDLQISIPSLSCTVQQRPIACHV